MQKTYQYKGEKNIIVKFPIPDTDLSHKYSFKSFGDKKEEQGLLVTDDANIQKVIEGSNAFKTGVIEVISGQEVKSTPVKDSSTLVADKVVAKEVVTEKVSSPEPTVDERFAEIANFNEAVKAIKEAYEITDHSVVGSKAALKAYAEENNISLPLIFPSEG